MYIAIHLQEAYFIDISRVLRIFIENQKITILYKDLKKITFFHKVLMSGFFNKITILHIFEHIEEFLPKNNIFAQFFCCLARYIKPAVMEMYISKYMIQIW